MELGTFVSGQLANKNREEQLKLDKEAHEMEMKKQREVQQQEQEAHEAKMKREKEELELDKERRAAKKEELDLLEKELKLKEQFKALEKVRVYLTGITVSCQCVGICHVCCSPFLFPDCRVWCWRHPRHPRHRRVPWQLLLPSLRTHPMW